MRRLQHYSHRKENTFWLKETTSTEGNNTILKESHCTAHMLTRSSFHLGFPRALFDFLETRNNTAHT